MKPNTYKVGDHEDRPWGSWIVMDVMPRAVVKKITLIPGARISLQRHKFRSERWIVVEGTASIRQGMQLKKLCAGESAYLPKLCLHRLANEEDQPLVLIEVQFGEILSEDDIERFDDDYGREDE